MDKPRRSEIMALAAAREMVLEAIHPGVDLDEVRSEVSWELRVREPLGTTEEPGEDILRLIREELDPKGIYLG